MRRKFVLLLTFAALAIPVAAVAKSQSTYELHGTLSAYTAGLAEAVREKDDGVRKQFE